MSQAEAAHAASARAAPGGTPGRGAIHALWRALAVTSLLELGGGCIMGPRPQTPPKAVLENSLKIEVGNLI